MASLRTPCRTIGSSTRCRGRASRRAGRQPLHNRRVPPLRASEYLLAGRTPEVERLRVQALAWEGAGRSLIAQIPKPDGARCVDVACGALGWLRVLSEWA